MINILCVCGNGMGTSTLLKVNLKKLCTKHGVDADIESCAFSEASSYMISANLIITSPEWADMLPKNSRVKVAVTKNLIDVAVIETTLLKALNEYFPAEITKK